MTAKRIPIFDETAPIACTIQPDEIPGRLATIERMRKKLHRVERTENGLFLHFSPGRPDIEADLRQFVVDEKRCCQFWGFEIVDGDDVDTALGLRWEGPPDAGPLLDRLEEFFAGDEPVESLADLL